MPLGNRSGIRWPYPCAPPHLPFGCTLKRETCALVTKMLPVSFRFVPCGWFRNNNNNNNSKQESWWVFWVAKMSPHKLPNRANRVERIELPWQQTDCILLDFAPPPTLCSTFWRPVASSASVALAFWRWTTTHFYPIVWVFSSFSLRVLLPLVSFRALSSCRKVSAQRHLVASSRGGTTQLPLSTDFAHFRFLRWRLHYWVDSTSPYLDIALFFPFRKWLLVALSVFFGELLLFSN